MLLDRDSYDPRLAVVSYNYEWQKHGLITRKIREQPRPFSSNLQTVYPWILRINFFELPEQREK